MRRSASLEPPRPVSRLLRRSAAIGALGLLAGCTTPSTPAPATSSGSPVSSRPADVSTVRGRHVVVTGDTPTSRLRQVATDADRAVGWVTRIWGDRWQNGRVPIRVPRTRVRFEKLGGGGPRVSATTTPTGTIVLNPSVADRVTALGQVVVLAHELTHVALRQYRPSDTPRWVIEGSAEVTAYRPTSMSLARAAPQVARQVRHHRAPAGPPGDAELASDAPRLQRAYQQAYAWCRFLVDRFGLPRFVAFVRAADADSDGAFEQAFGARVGGLSAAYRSWLRARVQGSGH